MANKNEILEPVDHLQFKPSPIVGVDEVGRGCLAGPVYAGAVCLRSNQALDLLTDSKLLSELRREQIAPLIWQAHWVGIGIASVEEIDRINILQASLLAMKRAVMALETAMGGQQAGHVLVDGNQKMPNLQRQQTTIIKGDLRCLPISAASIVAKVARDALMRNLAVEFPRYGFEKHKGYASETHRKSIAEYGPTLHHRKSFKGVKEFLHLGS